MSLADRRWQQSFTQFNSLTLRFSDRKAELHYVPFSFQATWLRPLFSSVWRCWVTLPNLKSSAWFMKVEHLCQHASMEQRESSMSWKTGSSCAGIPPVTTGSLGRKTRHSTLSAKMNSSVHYDILNDSDIQAVTSLSASLWSRHLPTAATQWLLTDCWHALIICGSAELLHKPAVYRGSRPIT